MWKGEGQGQGKRKEKIFQDIDGCSYYKVGFYMMDFIINSFVLIVLK